jgi:hypothetical protein
LQKNIDAQATAKIVLASRKSCLLFGEELREKIEKSIALPAVHLRCFRVVQSYFARTQGNGLVFCSHRIVRRSSANRTLEFVGVGERPLDCIITGRQFGIFLHPAAKAQ